MRYIILVLLNLPIIFIAFLSLFTKYKLRHISRERFRLQVLVWGIILVALVGSFPVYNIITGRPPLGSSELSVFDIVQTTAIIFLLYIVNNQRQKTDRLERTLRDLHSSTSILLSEKGGITSGSRREERRAK